MTKAELKYTGGKKRTEIIKYLFVKLSAKNTTMYRNGNACEIFVRLHIDKFDTQAR